MWANVGGGGGLNDYRWVYNREYNSVICISCIIFRWNLSHPKWSFPLFAPFNWNKWRGGNEKEKLTLSGRAGEMRASCGWAQRTRTYGLAQLQGRRACPTCLKMPWARFITVLCTLRLSRRSVCKPEITPTSQNLLWGWPCPHIPSLGSTNHPPPPMDFGLKSQETERKMFSSGNFCFPSLAAILSLDKTKQKPTVSAFSL